MKKTKGWKKFSESTISNEKIIADSKINDTMKTAKEEKGSDMVEIFHLGKIRTDVFKKKFGKIRTNKVAVTNERIGHIKSHHPEDYRLFEQYGEECIINPDIIVSDEKNKGTVFMIKKLPDIV